MVNTETSKHGILARDKSVRPARCRERDLSAKWHVVLLAFYLGLALLLTFPLVTQFGDHVPGTTTWSMDEYGYVWNNWWFKHAVFDLGTNPFQTNMLFYPIGTSLVLYTFTLLHVLLGLPVQFALGLIPASNVELILAFVVSAYGAFLLSRYLIRTLGDLPYPNHAAVVAGAVFAFASNRFVYASLGHYNVVATEWIPFYVLFLVKTVREPKWRNALLAGLFAACAMYVETADGVLLLLFTLLYLAFHLRRIADRAVLARLGLAALTAGVLFAPLLVPTAVEIVNSGYSLPGWGHAERLLVDLFGFVTPTSLQPLNRHWVQELDLVRQTASRFIDINTVFLGYVTLALACVAAIRFWKSIKVWVASAVAFAVLCLGPLLHINGQSVFDFDGLQVTIPMPFLLLHYVPFLRENRVPNRFSVLVMLSLAVLVGFAVAWGLGKLQGFADGERIRNRPLRPVAHVGLAVVLIAILFEHAAVPLPLTDARVPEVYAAIAREPGDFAVLTLPLGWRNSFGQQGAEDTRVQYYQSAHQKYTFPGNIQRNPPLLFDYFDRISFFHSITQLEFYQQLSDETIARDRAEAPGLMSFFDVRYVVIEPAIPGRPPYSDTHDAVADYVRQVLPLGDKVYDRDGTVAYRVNQPTLPAKLQVSFGAPAAHLYQAEGWDRDEAIADQPANWANRQDARLLLPIQQVSDYALTVRALPFTYPQSPAQTMDITVNGVAAGHFVLKPEWQTYTATLPAQTLHAGLNDIVFHFGYAVRPRDAQAANFAVSRTGVSSPADIVVNSGTLGSIRVNGREVSRLGRGYNVVVVDQKTGAVVSSKVFNTGDERYQSRDLTDFIAALPSGQIVAVAAQEDVAGNLGDKTVEALRSLGAQVDIRKTPDRSHAIIGVKGAAAGTALEQAKSGTSFISVGHNPDERSLAAAITSIVVERK